MDNPYAPPQSVRFVVSAARGKIAREQWITILGGWIVIYEFFFCKLFPINVTEGLEGHLADKIFFENGPFLGWLIATWTFNPERLVVFGVGILIFLLGVYLMKRNRKV